MKDGKFNNIESIQKAYANDTLMPWIIRWEQEIKIKLLVDEEDVSAKHVLQALLRGSASDRTALYKMMWMVGAMSANDILKLEDTNGIGPKGDIRFIPLNMQVLKENMDDEDDDDDDDEPSGPNDSLKGIPGENEGVPRRDDMDSAHIESAQRVLADSIESVLRRELGAVSRALKTHPGYEFLHWMEEFYGSEAHVEKLTERLNEVYPSLCSLLGMSEQREVAEMVEQYGNDSKYTLSLCGNTEQIQEQLEQWRKTKAQEYATRWLSI